MNMQVEYLIKKALDFEAQGKPLHALQVYLEILEIDRVFPQTYAKLASLYEKLRNPERAFELLHDYLDNIQEDTELRLLLGQMLIKYSDWKAASEVLMFFPVEEQPIVQFFLGYANYMSGDYELSKLNLERFILTNPESELLSESYITLAKNNIAMELYDEALENLEKASDQFKDNWEIHKLSGMIYYNKGMYLHSATSMEKAISLNPGENTLFELAGKAYLKLADYENAKKNLLKCVSVSEPSSETYTCLGLVYLNTRNIIDASNYFDMALTLDPMNEVALDGKRKCNS